MGRGYLCVGTALRRACGVSGPPWLAMHLFFTITAFPPAEPATDWNTTRLTNSSQLLAQIDSGLDLGCPEERECASLIFGPSLGRTAAVVEPPTSGRVVFLNGPPSVGKSATAAALQELLPTPHYYFSLDDYLCGYRDSHWLADDGTLFARMVEPYLRNIVTLLSFGHDVLAEAMVLPASQGLYLRLFAGQRVTFVGVRCSLEVATRRELQRENRRKGPINLDVPEFTLVHAHGAYDLEVDTSESAPADVWQRRSCPSSTIRHIRQRSTACGARNQRWGRAPEIIPTAAIDRSG